jgi:exonuclease SbcC
VKSTQETLEDVRKGVTELEGLANFTKEYGEKAAQLKVLESALEAHHQRALLITRATDLRARIEDDLKQLAATPAPDVRALQQEVASGLERVTAAKASTQLLEADWRARLMTAEKGFAATGAALAGARMDLQKAEGMIAKGKCPECSQKIGADYEHTLTNRRELVERLAGELNAYEEAVKRAAQESAELEDARKQLDSLPSRPVGS